VREARLASRLAIGEDGVMNPLLAVLPLLLFACAGAPAKPPEPSDPAAGPLHRFVAGTAVLAPGAARPRPGTVLPLAAAAPGAKDDLTAALAAVGLREAAELEDRTVPLELDRETALSARKAPGWRVTLRALLPQTATYRVRWDGSATASPTIDSEVQLPAGGRAAVVGPEVAGGRVAVLVVELARGARLYPAELPSPVLTDPPLR
jgi:hypothetical protein